MLQPTTSRRPASPSLDPEELIRGGDPEAADGGGRGGLRWRSFLSPKEPIDGSAHLDGTVQSSSDGSH